MRRRTIFILLMVLLMILGFVLFRAFNPGEASIPEESGFQAWLWTHRTLDLALQVVLIFAGALGIAAIIPLEEEDHG